MNACSVPLDSKQEGKEREGEEGLESLPAFSD